RNGRDVQLSTLNSQLSTLHWRDRFAGDGGDGVCGDGGWMLVLGGAGCEAAGGAGVGGVKIERRIGADMRCGRVRNSAGAGCDGGVDCAAASGAADTDMG